MNYNTSGKITKISEIKELPNGAKELTYRIDTGAEYNNVMEFQVYKKAEHSEHMDNFVKYNKVGDNVNIEFTIRTFNWRPESDDKIFTSLSHWKLEKVDATTKENANTFVAEGDDDLPF